MAQGPKTDAGALGMDGVVLPIGPPVVFRSLSAYSCPWVLLLDATKAPNRGGTIKGQAPGSHASSS
jgi:hypothetical protein